MTALEIVRLGVILEEVRVVRNALRLAGVPAEDPITMRLLAAGERGAQLLQRQVPVSTSQIAAKTSSLESEIDKLWNKYPPP